MKNMQFIAAMVAFAAATGASALDAGGNDAVAWACGGAGEQERIELKSLEPYATAELLFVTEKRGGYLADVDFVVRDQKGAPVLQGRADGPKCLLKVPAGRYRVEASFEGSQRVANLQVAKTSGKPVRAVLAFPRDSSETIAPSAEEKAGVLVK